MSVLDWWTGQNGWEVLASLSTHLTFTCAVLLAWLLPRVPAHRQHQAFVWLLLTAGTLHGIAAILDTTLLHLPVTWEGWPWWRRTIWRPLTMIGYAGALWWCWRWRRPTLVVPYKEVR